MKGIIAHLVRLVCSVMLRQRCTGPLFVLFYNQRADQPYDGIVLGKDATDSVRRLISPLRPF